MDSGSFYQGPGQSDGYEEPTAIGGLVRHIVTWGYTADAWYSGVLGTNNRVVTITFDVSVKDYIEALEADVPRPENSTKWPC